MYVNEFERRILSLATPPNFFFLYGQEPYQCEYCAKELLKKYPAENLLKLYYDEYDFSAARSHLAESSLFAASNTLYIKTDSRIPAKEVKELVALCQKSSDNALVLESSQDFKAGDEYLKIFGQNIVRTFAPDSPAIATAILQRHARALGLNISNEALAHIYALQHESLYLSASELNKLSMIAPNMSDSAVEAMVYGLAGISFDGFFDKILNKEPLKEDFFNIAGEANFNEIGFLKMIYASFYRLFRITANTKLPPELSKLPPKVLSRLQNKAVRLNERRYKEIFVFLNEAEFELAYKIKSDKSLYLLSVILHLQDLV